MVEAQEPSSHVVKYGEVSVLHVGERLMELGDLSDVIVA